MSCEILPSEIGCSGMTCWRLRGKQNAGVWTRLHRTLPERVAEADKLD
jgi:hypothetical protein